jgi:Uma2 family endonuclease
LFFPRDDGIVVKELRRGRTAMQRVSVSQYFKKPEAAALVIQPDILFVASARLHIVSDRIWGPPDLVVEILSPRTARRDRTIKLGWYRRYGVPETWLVDIRKRSVEVVDLEAADAPRVTFKGNQPVLSRILPRWTIPTEQIFE